MNGSRSGGGRRRLPPFFSIALLGSLLAIAGCAGPREPGLGEGIVVSRPEAEDGMTDAQRGRVEDRLREVDVLLVRGNDEGALAIVDDLLAGDLPDDLAARARGLRLDIRRRIHREPPVRGRLSAGRDLYAFGEELELTIELENVSDHVVEIPLEAEGETGFIFLRILREEIDVYGNVREDVEQGRLTLPGSAVIAPGDRRRAVRHLPTGARTHDGFTVYHVSGHVRPSVVVAGDREDFRSIPLSAVTVRVLPRNWEPLAEDPLGSVRQALAKRAPIHLLVAAELVPDEARATAAEAIVDVLRAGDGSMARPAMAALRRLTGQDLALEPSTWVAWWDGDR